MSNDRKNKALARISDALARLDTLAQSPIPEPEGIESAAELAALQDRHAKLREETTIALSALDAVIARASSGARS